MSDIFVIKQGDTSPSLEFALLPASVTLTGASVVFNMRRALGGVLAVNRQAAVKVTETVTPTVRYDWQAGDTAAAGVYQGEFEVTYGDGSIETFPNDGFIGIRIVEQIA